MNIGSNEVRKRFLTYFTTKLKDKNLEHVEVPSSLLVPEKHPTLLFTNSGMVQFTPYFLGEKDATEDFKSERLCSVQKCVRTGDIDIVGQSKYHLTFFEMLGSWSIGNYGKKIAVELAYDLLTNSEYGFGLNPERLIATVFAGDDVVPCDNETINAWKAVGIPEERISKLPASENWWAPGGIDQPGPCGPCTEVLYDRGENFGEEEIIPGLTSNPRYLEIWNAGVFMQYNRKTDGSLEPLSKMSVDTGAGLERLTLLFSGKDSVYETDLFQPIIEKIKEIAGKDYVEDDTANEAIRRCADHIKACSFMIVDGVYPSNKDQGYVVRRLLRRVINDFIWVFNIDVDRILDVVPVVIDIYKETYPEINNLNKISSVIEEEIKKTRNLTDVTKKYILSIAKSLSRSSNGDIIIKAFDVFQSTGAPVQLSIEIASKLELDGRRIVIDFDTFERDFADHKKESQQGAGVKFKGGLSGDDPSQKKLHTATHLLQQALRLTLGDHVMQEGSNVNSERLRFDFSHTQKLTDEEIGKVESLVNQKIKEALPVNSTIMSKCDAEKTGALHFFGEKYGDDVKIYFVGDNLNKAWSKEFCGGPHVDNTSELGIFKIIKETAVSKGIRRIKAVLV